MRYIVSIGYDEFCFYEPSVAMHFAETAATSMVDRDDLCKVDVMITLITEEEEKKEGN